MGKPHPIELRSRVIAHVEEGHTHRATAAHFKVSIRFVNDMVKLKRETGTLSPKRQGHGYGHGKLEPYKAWLLRRVEEQADITLHQLSHELYERFRLRVHYSSIFYLFRRAGLSHKKRQFGPKSNNALMSCKPATNGNTSANLS